MGAGFDGWHSGVLLVAVKFSNVRFAAETTLIAANNDEMVELFPQYFE